MVAVGPRRCRSTLGGTGLALSAACRHPAAALEFARFVASRECQQTLYFQSGGQPGHRTAWLNPGVNAACGNFFLDTLPALDRAFLRPRYAGHMAFQDRAGMPIRDYLRHGGDPRKLLEELNVHYRQSFEGRDS
jgi:multiple sugar transport system substrate-binding protein